MALDGIERIDEDTISMDGFTVAATLEEEEFLRKAGKEQRYEFIKRTGQK